MVQLFNALFLLILSSLLMAGCSNNIRPEGISRLDGSQLYYYELMGVKADSFNTSYADKLIGEVWQHAIYYPPKFENEIDKRTAIRNIILLTEEFEKIAADNYMDTNYLWRAAVVNHMGYNLDILGAHERALKLYKKFLKKEPKSAQGYFFYGNLQAESLYVEQAIPIFEKAAMLGEIRAHRSLTLAYVQLRNIEKAKQHVACL